MNRYLEIGPDGIAFSELKSSAQPALELYRCNCEDGATWNEQNPPLVGSSASDAACLYCGGLQGMSHSEDGLTGHVFVHPETRPQTLEEWQAQHKDCGYRRLIFVDVTHRPKAALGMRYDEAADTFSEAPKTDQADAKA